MSKEEPEQPTEAEALLEIAQALRRLPYAMVDARRPKRTGIAGTYDAAMRAVGMDPDAAREAQQRREERAEARRAEIRSNIAIGIAALAAIGSILGVVLH
jgi:hypothetical protein